MLRANDMVPAKYHVLRQMIEGVQAAPTAGCGSKTGGLVERLLLAKNDPPKATLPAASPIVVRTDDAPRYEAPPVPQFIPLADFLQFAERVAQQNAADDHWNEKTQRQARSSAAPFVKFMV